MYPCKLCKNSTRPRYTYMTLNRKINMTKRSDVNFSFGFRVHHMTLHKIWTINYSNIQSRLNQNKNPTAPTSIMRIKLQKKAGNIPISLFVLDKCYYHQCAMSLSAYIQLKCISSKQDLHFKEVFNTFTTRIIWQSLLLLMFLSAYICISKCISLK